MIKQPTWEWMMPSGRRSQKHRIYHKFPRGMERVEGRTKCSTNFKQGAWLHPIRQHLPINKCRLCEFGRRKA